jgi:hypothetical protein
MEEKQPNSIRAFVSRHPILTGAGALVVLFVLVKLIGSGNDRPAPSVAIRECGPAEAARVVNGKVSRIVARFNEPYMRQFACEDFADQLGAPSLEVTETFDMEQQANCSFMDDNRLVAQLPRALERHRASAARICGPSFDRRVTAARERAEFTSILLHDNAGDAFRKIGNRMAAFAPREDLRRCLEAVGAGRETAVMQQMFVELVAMCEVQLGIEPLRPEQRWTLPNITLNLPSAAQPSNSAPAGNDASSIGNNQLGDEGL